MKRQAATPSQRGSRAALGRDRDVERRCHRRQGPERIITSWNSGAEGLFGYTLEEAIGRLITILVPDDRMQEEADILGRLRDGEHVEHFETVRRRKDGSPIEISVSVAPIKGVKGEVIGASKTARDITERKRRDGQIVVLAREAEHRSKNLLATVQATIRLTQADTTAALKDAIAGRIQALATSTHSSCKRNGQGRNCRAWSCRSFRLIAEATRSARSSRGRASCCSPTPPRR